MNASGPPLPETVHVTDITARDGFQNVEKWIPSETKERIIDLLVASGVRRMEAASFVSPKAIPQMRDAARISEYVLSRYPQVAAVALAPNLRGARDAVAAGIKEISYIISASPAHNQANIKRSVDESLADLSRIRESFPDLRINLSMSAVFGSPFEGEVKTEWVLRLLAESVKRGVVSASLCDTIGVANPLQVRGVLREVRGAFPELPIALHFHDTHGMGLANIFAALQAGVDCFETAVGGLGGCPFAPGAAGNTATEDMVNMLHRMRIDTGIDLEKLLLASRTISDEISANIPARLATARSYLEFDFFPGTDL